jgi:hypothetical protein
MVKFHLTSSVKKFYFILPMTKKKEIYFIYNAKGGKWNYIVDTIHKYASPSTYECNLCQITHDLKMRKAWKDFVNKTPHLFNFLHLEELKDFGLEEYENQLPICLEKNNEKFTVLVDKETMNNFKNEFDLIDRLNKIL